MPAAAPQVVCQFMGGNREQVCLKLTSIIEMGQTVEETDEGLLHDIFTRGPIVQAPLDKGQQPTLIARNQVLPGARITLADLLDQQPVGFGSHVIILVTAKKDVAASFQLAGKIGKLETRRHVSFRLTRAAITPR